MTFNLENQGVFCNRSNGEGSVQGYGKGTCEFVWISYHNVNKQAVKIWDTMQEDFQRPFLVMIRRQRSSLKIICSWAEN